MFTQRATPYAIFTNINRILLIRNLFSNDIIFCIANTPLTQSNFFFIRNSKCICIAHILINGIDNSTNNRPIFKTNFSIGIVF